MTRVACKHVLQRANLPTQLLTHTVVKLHCMHLTACAEPACNAIYKDIDKQMTHIHVRIQFIHTKHNIMYMHSYIKES